MEEMVKKDEIVLFESGDHRVSLDVTVESDTVWLTQAQMVELFERDQSVVSRHINAAFREEVSKESNMHFLHIANSDKPVAFYSLDVIISVGYRVRSIVGTRFRQWATQRLREYIVKGFTLDDKRLKGNGGGLYWKELLDRIRDIRSSEKVLYRQVLDLYATSIDYNPKAEESIRFFKIVQNKLHYAAPENNSSRMLAQ